MALQFRALNLCLVPSTHMPVISAPGNPTPSTIAGTVCMHRHTYRQKAHIHETNREIAQGIECLSRQHENLSLDAEPLCKKQVLIPGLALTGQPAQLNKGAARSAREPVSREMVREEDTSADLYSPPTPVPRRTDTSWYHTHSRACTGMHTDSYAHTQTHEYTDTQTHTHCGGSRVTVGLRFNWMGWSQAFDVCFSILILFL